jgi:hypothetical protein
MEREDVMRRIKLAIDSPGHRDGLRKNKAAQLLGISRQRVTQLYAAWTKKKGAPKMEPKPPPPVVQPEAPAVPTPTDINAVLSPIGGSGALPPPPPPPVAPGPDDVVFKYVPDDGAPPQGEPVDAEDAAAGRDLVRWFVRGFKEGLARWMFKIKKDDPRMAEIREENEFLRIAIKRNSEKAAPLGKLTKGPWGLAIGSLIETIKMAFVIEDKPDDLPATPFKVVPRNDDPPPPPAKRGENEPRRPMSMDEKIAAANKAQGLT